MHHIHADISHIKTKRSKSPSYTFCRYNLRLFIPHTIIFKENQIEINDSLPYTCQILFGQVSCFSEGTFQQYTMSLYEGSKKPEQKVSRLPKL